MRPRSFKVLAAVTSVAVAMVGRAAHGENVSNSWALPTPPDTTVLSGSFPNCLLDTLDNANKCLSDLEFYRGQVLEATYHLGSLRTYSRDLTRISAQLEAAHAAGRLDASTYEQIHGDLQDALEDANNPDGKYQLFYTNYYKKFIDYVKNAKQAVFRFTHQI